MQVRDRHVRRGLPLRRRRRRGATSSSPLLTGDLAKGSATTDPDDYPLYYAGSRDNLFRIIATDRDPPEVLWTIDARTSVPEWKWNDDWDGSALVVDGYLIEGGRERVDLRRCG